MPEPSVGKREFVGNVERWCGIAEQAALGGPISDLGGRGSVGSRQPRGQTDSVVGLSLIANP
jgi:hypothetical protein